ncbi:MAG: hypothetical protein ABID38_05755 [Candidatus Diapherotrites archaeon]
MTYTPQRCSQCSQIIRDEDYFASRKIDLYAKLIDDLLERVDSKLKGPKALDPRAKLEAVKKEIEALLLET